MPATEEREYSHAKTGDLDVFLSFLPTQWEHTQACALRRRDSDSVHRSQVSEHSTQWEEPWKGDILWNENSIVWVNRAEGKIQNILHSGQ
jgi:hypothetical protein